MKKLLAAFPLVALVALSGCGALDQAKEDATEKAAEKAASDKASDKANKAAGSLALADIQLKSASQLAVHTENVFGPGMDKLNNPPPRNNNEPPPPSSIYQVYQNNFGSEAGLKVGDKFGDAPTEAYFMGLSIVGDTLARNCQTDVLSKREKSKCYCASEESAKALLGRAFVHWDFEDAKNAEFVKKFAAGCQANYRATINGMVMSLAFALRR